MNEYPDIETVLVAARAAKASDVHVLTMCDCLLRIDGSLVDLKNSAFTDDQIKKFLADNVSAKHMECLEEHKEMDAASNIPDAGRVRIHGYKSTGGVNLVLRLLNDKIPTLEGLKMPMVLGEILKHPSGIILVTGPTGSGKTTLLAAMLDRINRQKPLHIYTVEDPVEYLHESLVAKVSHREVGDHAESFPAALRGALRSDPDVILVGEMRDLDTMQTALTAAETGHLVLATLHSSHAAQTITRFVDGFPPAQQEQVRMQLADSLRAIIGIRLIPLATGKGRIPALEIMICNTAIKACITGGKISGIRDAIATNIGIGMQTMERHLQKLVDEGKITYAAAKDAAVFPEDMKRDPSATSSPGATK